MESVDRRGALVVMATAGIGGFVLSGCNSILSGGEVAGAQPTPTPEPLYLPSSFDKRQEAQKWAAFIAPFATQLDQHLTKLGVHTAYPLMKYRGLSEADRKFLGTNINSDGYFSVEGDYITIVTSLHGLNEAYKPEDLIMVTSDRRGQVRFSIDPLVVQPSALFTLDYARFLSYPGSGSEVSVNLSSNDLRYYLKTDRAIKNIDITSSPSDLTPVLK